MNHKTYLVRRIAAGWLAFGIVCLVAGVGVADAKSIRVFALGASNTNGRGVGSDEAWPAQLERMLRARGYEVTFGISAINGDTSAGVLSRTSAIPDGTQAVVFDTGGDNDRLHGFAPGEPDENRKRDPCAPRGTDPGALHQGVSVRSMGANTPFRKYDQRRFSGRPENLRSQ